MDRLCCCIQKSPSLQHHLYCSSAGARVWVCAMPEAHTVVSHLFRWAAVTLLMYCCWLFVILTTALLHRWMAAGDGSSAGVCASPEAQRVPHVSRWAAVHVLLLCFFNTIAAPAENIILYTAYTPPRRY